MEKKNEIISLSNENNFIIYKDGNDNIQIDVMLSNENIWLSQKSMAKLFDVQVPAINKHLKNIFEEGELQENATVSKMEIVQIEGTRQVARNVEFYNLDAILAVGYRVNSHRATMFRVWATKILKEYLVKGFAMNDEKLKNPNYGYFDELLTRIRDIRSSEKIFYSKVLDIYALSADYSPNSEESQKFFATVQNKMHFAVSGHTASELIYNRADANKDFMGLTHWTGRMPHKNDATTAKNYLNQEELETLNLIVNLYLDFAELQAKSNRVMYMQDWIDALDDFLKISRKEILTHYGKISKEVAILKAETEYNKFKERTQYELTPVERHFLESIEKTSKQIQDKHSNTEDD